MNISGTFEISSTRCSKKKTIAKEESTILLSLSHRDSSWKKEQRKNKNQDPLNEIMSKDLSDIPPERIGDNIQKIKENSPSSA